MNLGEQLLEGAKERLRVARDDGKKAIAQLPSDAAFHAPLDPESSRIAVIVRHLSGSMTSRWTDFFETDEEKPSRRSDAEFAAEQRLTRIERRRSWDAGWDVFFAERATIRPGNLLRTATIRDEPLSVAEAIHRQMTHASGHVGQIVQLARHALGPQWRTISIPRGSSRDAAPVST